MIRRREAIARLAGVLLAPAAGTVAAADAPALQAPNVVPIDARIVTSGQPGAAALAGLGRQGYGAVVYLAPLTVPDAVPDEPAIVRAQGLEFVHLPIPFNQPTADDAAAFIAAMKRLADRKVLVHCQVNLRASSMTFLYRVIERRESPELAYEAVQTVWSPSGAWRALIVAELRRAGVAFEPY